MLMDFIAMIAFGAIAALAVVIVNHIGGRVAGFRLPKWAMPVAIGTAMIAFTIWNEYTWYPRARAQLPDTLVVVSAPEESTFYRPWTYAAPLVTRFVALDRAPGEAAGPKPFATLAYVVVRWSGSVPVPVAFDCARGLRADLVDGAKLNPDGTLSGAEWLTPGEGDPLLRAACMGG